MRCRGRGRAGRLVLRVLLLGALAFAVAPAAAQAAITVGDVQATEANADVNVTFTITREAGALAPARTVNFQTTNGTAFANADYTPANGSRTFAATLLPATQVNIVTVTIRADSLDEPNESFRLVVSGTEVTEGDATATIADDDPPPAIAVDDPAGTTEGTDSAKASFAVRLSTPSGRAVAVAYATADISAKAGADYVAKTGTVTIPAGGVSAPVVVSVTDDTASEPSESFELRLSAPSSATLGDAAATATILDDDGMVAGSGGTLAGGSRLGLFGLKLKRNRVVAFKVSCPEPAGRCRGRATLFSRPTTSSKFKALRRERRLGRKRYAIDGGRSRTIQMTLHRADRRLLLRAGRLRVRVFATAEDATGHAGTRTLLATIRVKKRR